ncbi:fluoride efflux transporter FluC [Dictyobacter arantiisoli]|uniref:fluoride efflux transporter FluC n=1 Tax=Dictyobacter arantiisoli TaxID=2014874 RepID=UPI00155A663C|nr:CrcB family protein [Dictyobacter arantiisoli]
MHKEHLQLKRLLIVFCGGFLGTLVRYLLSHTIQGILGTGWPYDILLINITGAFVLAFLSTLADATVYVTPERRLFLNVGFLGAYTTFSSLALGDVNLFANQKIWLALLYLAGSLLGGVLAALTGQFWGYKIVQRVRARQSIGVQDQDELLGVHASTQALRDEEQLY